MNTKKNNKKNKKNKKTCKKGFPKTENLNVFNFICRNNEKLAEAPKSGLYSTHDYLTGKNKGIFICACCGNKLYESKFIFNSHTGWPAFGNVLKKTSVKFDENTKEVKCYKCGLHLGHRFSKKRQNHKFHDCINSACLHFIAK